jgi:hypothetical protein
MKEAEADLGDSWLNLMFERAHFYRQKIYRRRTPAATVDTATEMTAQEPVKFRLLRRTPITEDLASKAATRSAYLHGSKSSTSYGENNYKLQEGLPADAWHQMRRRVVVRGVYACHGGA